MLDSQSALPVPSAPLYSREICCGDLLNCGIMGVHEMKRASPKVTSGISVSGGKIAGAESGAH